MSNLFRASLPSSRRTAYQRQIWGEFFGQLIQGVREELGRSIEDAARLAGMKAWEWEDIEAGQVPRTWAQLGAITDALEVNGRGRASLALYCRQAWRA